MPTEHEDQVCLMRWKELRKATLPELELLYSVENGGLRNKITGARLKAAGIRRGVPDLCLPVPRGGFHALYVELKRQGSGVVSPEQKWWLEELNRQGCCATVCYGWDDARQVIENYLLGDEVRKKIMDHAP